jgi:hypothetical protein
VSPTTAARPIAGAGTRYVASRVPVAASTAKSSDESSASFTFVPAKTTPFAAWADDQLVPISCVQSVSPSLTSNAWRCSGVGRQMPLGHWPSDVQPMR